ncbi:MAG TPA: cysteine peptidase family C39 domain-containing protein [Polyangiaceae bacterium]|nr:cysteine peptidase family C39 domain-containing protein [Polyangiaceae bacterium]
MKPVAHTGRLSHRPGRPRALALRCVALGSLVTTACASYRGTAESARIDQVVREPGWVGVANLPDVRQSGAKDCGAAALSAVLGYWGQPVDAERLDRELRAGPGRGIRAGDLRDYARGHGLLAFAFYGSLEDVKRELALGRPVIVGTIKPYDDGRAAAHYEVVVGYHPGRRLVMTLDPAHGFRKNSLDGFMAEWASTNWVTLVVMAPPG